MALVAVLGAASALLGAGAAPAVAVVATEAAEIFVAAGPESAVFFKVEGTRVYVLAAGAKYYCTRSGPTEKRESTESGVLGEPLVMRASGSSLIANERGTSRIGWRRINVEASFSGERLVGSLDVLFGQGSVECQTGHYRGEGGSRIPIEAIRLVPIGSPSAATPAAEEASLYFGAAAGVEALFIAGEKRIVTSGASTSRCQAGGRRPLFGEWPVDNEIGEGGKFRRRSTRLLERNGVSMRETGLMTGTIGTAAVSGSYRRETVLNPFTSRARRCADPAVRFHAVRYVPVARRVKAKPPTYVPAAPSYVPALG